MTLVQRLWLAVLAIIALTLAASAAVHVFTARHYLERQLQLKNIDNAQTLALSLSQLDKDPVTVELMVSAQFDTGHYAWIRLVDATGATLVERRHEGEARAVAPAWFAQVVALHVAPGVAQVQDGWQPFGTLSVQSQAGYAYDAMWQGMQRLLAWFLVAAVVLGLLGSWALRRLTRPLQAVVAQAEAIGQRRFMQSEEPGTPELRSVVRAMNTLSQQVRLMLDSEAARVDALRRELQQDAVTGLASRAHLLASFEALRHDDNAPAEGVAVLLRLPALADLNRRLGRQGADRCLQGLARALTQWCADHPRALAGRLNGSDFLVVFPGMHDPKTLQAPWARLPALAAVDAPLPALAAAAGRYDTTMSAGALLSALDAGLVEAEHTALEGAAPVLRWVGPAPAAPALTGRDQWGQAMREALDEGGLALAIYPVVRSDGTLLHEEGVARLALPHGVLPAGSFLPWAERLGLLPRIDLAACVLALQRLREPDAPPQAINVSAQSLCDPSFRRDLQALLRSAPREAARLWLDLPEFAMSAHEPDLHALVDMLRPLRCRIGLEHVGRHATRLSELAPLGLAYLKIDAALVAAALDPAAAPGGESLLRELCALAHAMDMLAIAGGVMRAEDALRLADFGVNAFTGPGVVRRP